MKKLFISLIMPFSIFTFLFMSCIVDDVSPIDENAVPSATATIDGVNYTFNDVVLEIGSIFPSSGASYTGNNVIMTANNGLKIEVEFSRENTGTKQIIHINDFDAKAVITDTNGKKYNATSGTINITEYKSDGSRKQTSGTFSFTGVYWVNYSDSLVINVTNGVFDNAKN